VDPDPQIYVLDSGSGETQKMERALTGTPLKLQMVDESQEKIFFISLPHFAPNKPPHTEDQMSAIHYSPI